VYPSCPSSMHRTFKSPKSSTAVASNLFSLIAAQHFRKFPYNKLNGQMELKQDGYDYVVTHLSKFFCLNQ
jgi:hypothetical protein